MRPRQEFLVLEAGDQLAVYAPSQFPLGTPIGRDAQRLGVSGPKLVRPPETHLTRDQLDLWCRHLEEEGYAVTLGPFWRDPVSREEAEEAVRQGRTIPLKEAFDELLREAERRGHQEDQRVASVEPGYP